jgi:hypothetical protein
LDRADREDGEEVGGAFIPDGAIVVGTPSPGASPIVITQTQLLEAMSLEIHRMPREDSSLVLEMAARYFEACRDMEEPADAIEFTHHDPEWCCQALLRIYGYKVGGGPLYVLGAEVYGNTFTVRLGPAIVVPEQARRMGRDWADELIKNTLQASAEKCAEQIALRSRMN